MDIAMAWYLFGKATATEALTSSSNKLSDSPITIIWRGTW